MPNLPSSSTPLTSRPTTTPPAGEVGALLALEDGRVFRGQAFGACGTVTGEICFNTSMSGYQEILTDPSYHGQIVTMTYPLIGNYGTNPEDDESAVPHVRGFVVEEISRVRSNWRSDRSLNEYLTLHGIPGICGIDTRSLTLHLRTLGTMRACLTTELSDTDEAIHLAQCSEGVVGMDFVKEVTTREPYRWDPEDQASLAWAVGAPSDEDSLGLRQSQPTLPPTRYRIAALDLGMKRNILRRLRQEGFQVDVLPATASAQDIQALQPDGLFLSNGPGDPAALPYVHDTLRHLIGKMPIFGICLGHQVLGCAMGGRTFKLKFGHRGANQPVKDLATGKVSITSQNHGFAVDPESLPSEVQVSHINLNDQTVEGLRHRDLPIASVQYHPEASPGPHDASYFFAEFGRMIDSTRS